MQLSNNKKNLLIIIKQKNTSLHTHNQLKIVYIFIIGRDGGVVFCFINRKRYALYCKRVFRFVLLFSSHSIVYLLHLFILYGFVYIYI